MSGSTWPELSGRRFVVTGAGSGMGLAAVELFVASDVSVLGATRSDDGLTAIEAAGAEALRCDVTDPHDRDRLVEAAGDVHGLVLNHGQTMGQPIESVTKPDWDTILAANLESVFFLLQAFTPRMPDDAAVVVSSVAAKTGTIPDVAVYGAAKAGVDSLVRSFADAHAARGMRVNAVLPGIIDTAMQRRFLELNAPLRGLTPDAYHAQRIAATPMRRAGTPQEAAQLFAFLLSPRSSYLTGQCLNPPAAS